MPHEPAVFLGAGRSPEEPAQLVVRRVLLFHGSDRIQDQQTASDAFPSCAEKGGGEAPLSNSSSPGRREVSATEPRAPRLGEEANGGAGALEPRIHENPGLREIGPGFSATDRRGDR
jgi:hypothetical protein